MIQQNEKSTQKHKPVRSNTSPMIQKNGKAYQPEKNIDADVEEVWTVTHQEC